MIKKEKSNIKCRLDWPITLMTMVACATQPAKRLSNGTTQAHSGAKKAAISAVDGRARNWNARKPIICAR